MVKCLLFNLYLNGIMLQPYFFAYKLYVSIIVISCTSKHMGRCSNKSNKSQQSSHGLSTEFYITKVVYKFDSTFI